MGDGGGRSRRRVIFTYGTLKRGFWNHRLMEELIESGDAEFVGGCTTLESYPLVCGPYRVPFLLPMPGVGHRVWGEAYLVSDAAVTRMDELEGTTRNHYVRRPIRLSLTKEEEEEEGINELEAEAYFAHESYADEMWKRNGEIGYATYSEKEARGYVKRKDRPQNLTFLDHISLFLSSSPPPPPPHL